MDASRAHLLELALPRSSRSGTDLRVRVLDSWPDVVDDAVAEVRRLVPADPFASVPVVVQGAAARRALSQAIAVRTGTPDAGGVCAGIDLITLAELRRRVEEHLLERPASGDPWRRRALALTVLQVLQASGNAAWFEALGLHLAPEPRPGLAAERPGRWLATAERIAGLLQRYARHAPHMLRAWTLGDDTDALGAPLASSALWQPQVWRACRSLLAGTPDPVERHDLMVSALSRAGGGTGTGAAPLDLPERVLLVDPGPLPLADHEFLAALSASRPVQVLALRPASTATAWGHRLGLSERAALAAHAQVGGVVEESPRATGPTARTSVLARLQAALAAEPGPTVTHEPSSPAPSGDTGDGSVQVHASHGIERQVEVLRDVLAGLFADDPTLEPRDVVVLCPDLERCAPLVRAAFGTPGPDDPLWAGTTRHPASALRVQVSGSSLAEPNPALALLQQLLALPTARATGQDLLDLCASPVVASRFGLEESDLELLARLLSASEVRWGIDAAHRNRFGVGGVRQSTWLASLDRLLLGVAMGERPAGWLDTVAPVGMIGSKHVEVIGTASEVVSRVRRLMHLWEGDATMAEWVARLRDGLDQLAARSGPEAVVVAHARAQLALLAELTQDAGARVSRGDMRGQFDQLLRTGTGRANHGNGSLMVTRLGDLDDIEHRVVVVLGLDDGVLPPPVRHDGDDLVPRWATPETGVREVSLRHLHGAIRAAGDRLVVIHQGFDPRTNEPLAPAPVLADLAEACEPLGGVTGHDHTLLAESLHNFIGTDIDPPFSFDPVALRGAMALDHRVSTQVDDLDPPRDEVPAAPQPVDTVGALDLAELVTFLRNPAAAHLRSRLGLSLSSFRIELDPDLPIEADGLVRWRLGEQFLAAELAGDSLDEVERLARLSGDLPPGRLADQAVEKVRAQALRVGEAVLARTTRHGSRDRIAPVDHRIHLDLQTLGAGTLVGRVRTRHAQIVSWRFGRVRLVDLLDAWVQLLALQAQEPTGSWRAVCVGTDGVSRLRAPDADTCRTLLAELVLLRAHGLTQVVPMPLEVITALTELAPPGPWTPDPVRQAERAWDGVRDRPEWRMTLPLDYRELTRLPTMPDDPGRPAPGRLERLRTWLVDPLLAHLDREPLP